MMIMTRTTFILLLSSFWALSVAGEEQPSHSLMNDSDALTLDPQIRNWVLLPMVLIVLLVQFMRMYLIQYMGSDTKANVTEVQQKNTLKRAMALRSNGGYISRRGFQMRKEYFVAEKKGILRQEVKAPPQNPMSMMSQGGMKNQAVYMITNFGMGHWTSTFFSGFILGKVPFGLTHRFKQMTQRGIDLGTLDTAYLSSLSWYLIVLYGIRSFMMVITGGQTSDITDDAQMMQKQMGLSSGGRPGQWDPKKAYKQESENLQLATYKPKMTQSEDKLSQNCLCE